MKQCFTDGAVILTGKDFKIWAEAVINRRGAHDISCSFCQHEDDDKYCDGCSVLDWERCCSCHINPPCCYCTDSKFEVTPYLLNYQNCKANKKRRWECVKGNQASFQKLTMLEKEGFEVAAETLTTGEIAICIEKGHKDYEVEICAQKEFPEKLISLILRAAR